MADQTLYYAVPSSIARVHGRSILFLRAEGLAIELDATAGQVLTLCDGAKTLEAHAAVVRRFAPALAAHTVGEALASLVRGGALRAWIPRSEAAPGAVAATENGPDIVAVVTADRPASLRRTLLSLRRHCAAFDRHPRVLVVDGSWSHADATRAVAVDPEVTKGLDVHYVGHAEAARWRGRLAAAGLPPAVLDAGLTPGPVGSNRNLATLLSAGHEVLMIDDDVLCEPWGAAGLRTGVRLGGHADLREWHFFPTRRAAMAAAAPVDVDLLAAHGRLLGRSLEALIAAGGPSADFRDACRHSVAMAVAGRRAAVRVTFAGLAGDSGRYCPYRLLLLSGPVQRLLMSSEAALATALTSREITHVASQDVVTHDATCMSYCMGLVNRSVVPPFLPFGRNEDGLFGVMLSAADPGTLYAHVPYGIVHDSHRTPTYGDVRMPSAVEVRMSEVLGSLVQRLPSSALGSTPAARLTRIGESLVALGQLPLEEFIAAVGEVTLTTRSQQLDRLETLMASAKDASDAWRFAVGEYVQTLGASFTRPEFFLPREFHAEGSLQGQYQRAQDAARRFGELARWWPVIWETARSV